jgi:head-tail adaptor
MIEGLFNRTATISRYTAGTQNSLGEPARTWATLSTISCRIETTGGTESPRPQKVDTTHNLFTTPGTDITEKDRVISDSITYEVLFVNRLPGGTANHVEAELKEIRT